MNWTFLRFSNLKINRFIEQIKVFKIYSYFFYFIFSGLIIYFVFFRLTKEKSEEEKEDLIYLLFLEFSGARLILNIFFCVYLQTWIQGNFYYILFCSFVLFQQKTSGVSTAVKP